MADQYVKLVLTRCPYCGTGGERFNLPLPLGGTNHKCSQCGGIIQLESRGFSDHFLPEPEEPPADMGE